MYSHLLWQFTTKKTVKTRVKPCLHVYACVNTGKIKKRRWLHLIYGIRVSYFWSRTKFEFQDEKLLPMLVIEPKPLKPSSRDGP